MPRIARGHAGGEIYHLINRGNGRQQVFHKDQDYQAFVELLGEAGERIPNSSNAIVVLLDAESLPSIGQAKLRRRT